MPNRQAFGAACLPEPGHGLILFNARMWPFFSQDDLAVLVIHEAAHLIVGHRYGKRGLRSHGKTWRRVMQSLGVKNPVATVDLTTRSYYLTEDGRAFGP
jgi:predicted SprT family Zn-dependent metalloprotease